ncbi:MAG: hypothetical protein KAI61_04860 [Alphaproteobacteria bacterium]|nr:hypothetical protein [Alphaproteobacteria bacterium]MCK5658938.1 hypothetical protein [Alphaproteobacteria bacterium]
MTLPIISQIERNEFNPPTEERIKVIVEILGEDLDNMLALAKKIPSDLSGIIQKNPKEVAVFLRTAKGLSRDE